MSLLGEMSLTRRRFPAPTWTAGRPSTAAYADTTFLGSVQPMPGSDRHVLPEGTRRRDGRKVYCAQGTLRVDDQASGTLADQVLISGVAFTVVHVDDSHPLIGHDRAYLVRVQETG